MTNANATVPFVPRRLARVITDLLRLQTTYPLGEPVVGMDPTVPANVGRLFIGDGSTAGGLGVALLSELQAETTRAVAAEAAAAAQAGKVTSVAGKMGAVQLAVGDVTGAAPLASPVFTGTPQGPTAAAGDSSTNLATTAFVTAFVAALGYITLAGAAAVFPRADAQQAFVPAQQAQLLKNLGISLPPIRLTANLTLPINGATGNDTSADKVPYALPTTPFKTRVAAYAWAQQNLDITGFTLTFAVAAGTYTDDFFANGPIRGATPTTVVFQGNDATPSNCIINCATMCFSAGGGAVYTVSGFRVLSGNGNCLNASGFGSILRFGAMDFGQTNYNHLGMDSGGSIISTRQAYTISGGANAHFKGDSWGIMIVDTVTITFTNPNLAFTYFIQNGAAWMDLKTCNYQGNVSTVTGTRYACNENSTTLVGGVALTSLPGSYNGSCTADSLIV